MAEDIEVTEEVVENGYNPMMEMARKVLMASIGAIALTQEEIEKIVARLIERGEIAEKDGRKLIKDLMEKRRKKTEEVAAGTEDQIDSRMQDMLNRMNIPSKADIDALSVKISALTEKVDELNKE